MFNRDRQGTVNRLLKKTLCFAALNRLAPTYCEYASARRFSCASPLDLFEQPATRVFSSMLDRSGRTDGERTISNQDKKNWPCGLHGERLGAHQQILD